MTDLSSENGKNRNEDIDSKIADFMADIDEIVLGKKSNDHSVQSEWQQCFDKTTQAVYYWNNKTNECSWEPPPSTTTSQNHLIEKSINSTNVDGLNSNLEKKRQQSITDNKSPKKIKKPSLIAEYTSSDSEEEEEEEEEEENVDDIDELLNEVLDQKLSPVDLYPLFEADCRAAITRLTDLGDKTTEIYTLRIQLETRLEDCLAGHLSKSYAVSKLEEALIQIDEFEKLHLTYAPLSYIPEPSKPSLTTSEMALLLSLPPPPPPPSPPLPPTTNEDDQTLQLFYAQLSYDQSDPISSIIDTKKITTVTKSESHHQHHHHHKDKKSKPAKTLPTDLIQKWTHARQELHGDIVDIDDS